MSDKWDHPSYSSAPLGNVTKARPPGRLDALVDKSHAIHAVVNDIDSEILRLMGSGLAPGPFALGARDGGHLSEVEEAMDNLHGRVLHIREALMQL